MVDYKYFDLFYRNNTNKQAKIEYSGGVMSNVELFQNSEELKESLCSEKELQFGCCEASSLKFKIANIVKPLIGETVTFSIVIDHHEDDPFLIGKYKVASDKETADRRYREVMAYDAMYDILNADVAAWYNSVLPNEDSTVTLKQFRESFVRRFGLTEVLPKDGLVNDTMTVQRTIQPEQISGKDVITAICEINGCFGHIGRDGKFHYIYLPQAIKGLYPANDLYPDHAPEWMVQTKTGHLYPQDPKTTRIGKGSYIPPCNYESYRTKPITKIQIRQEENDIGKIWPETPLSDKDNCYIIQDNFLVYGKSSDELSVIAQNVLGKITDIVYRPFDCTAVGNPCMEVGDPVRLNTKYEIVESYILTRTMKGIQALRDTYKANGVEKYAEDVNGIHRSIIQLKGKTNEIFRDVEKTQSKITDVEKGLTTQITQTAGEIRGELRNEVNGLSNTISMTAGAIRGELNDAKDGLENQISVTAKGFEAELKNTREGLETSISITAGGIRTELRETENNLSNTISATAGEIRADIEKTYETKADAGAEYTSIRSSISLESGRISSEIERATRAEQTLAGQIISTESILSSKIEQTESKIQMEVSENYQTKTGSQEQYSRLQSSITQNANDIALKVSQSDYNGNTIASLINQSVSTVEIEAAHINLNGAITANGRFFINGDGSFNANYGMIGEFFVSDGFLSAHIENYDEEIEDCACIIYPPNNKGAYDDDYNLAFDIRHKSEEKESHPFYVTYRGVLGANTIIAKETFLENGAPVSDSDARCKNSIEILSEKEIINFLRDLIPCKFKYNSDISGRYHHGLIAQQVKDAMGEDDWGIYVEHDSGKLGLRYEELIPDLIMAYKQIDRRLVEIERWKENE